MSTPKTIKSGILRRILDRVEVTIRKEDGKDVLRFSASSEEPIERFFGTEILVHDKNAVRLERARAGAIPLLFNHDRNDPRGMVDKAEVEKKRLMVEAHFFDTEAGRELKQMVDDGLRNVSLAYRLHVVEEDVKRNTFRATDWEPLEVSIVSVPADPTVGVGRSSEEYEVRMISSDASDNKGATKMETKEQVAAAAAEQARAEAEAKNKSNDGTDSARTAIEVGAPKRTPVEFEQGRKKAIENMCRANQLDDKYRDHWIGTGATLEQVSEDILRILEERGKSNPQPASRLGLTAPEVQRYSLLRAIRAVLDKDWTMAPFELDCNRTLQKKLNRIVEPTKFLVPFEVLERPVDIGAMLAARAHLGLVGQRDLSVGVAGAGGFLVSTDNVGFIEILRNRSVAFRMGARRLSGLQGNVTIPRQSAAATAFWLGTEVTPITESEQAFVQVALVPKTVGAYTEVSRLLTLQSSPGAEGIVSDDLAQVVALAVDLAVLNGSGAAGQPTGILNTAGIGSVVGTALAYAGILEFQTDVAAANVMPLRGGYVTTPAVAALLMQRARFANTDTPLWEGNIWDGRVSGFPAMSSNQMPAASALFGDWQEAVVGEWGVLEVEVNPFANFQAGIIGVRAMYSVDVGVRRPFAFSAASTIT